MTVSMASQARLSPGAGSSAGCQLMDASQAAGRPGDVRPGRGEGGAGTAGGEGPDKCAGPWRWMGAPCWRPGRRLLCSYRHDRAGGRVSDKSAGRARAVPAGARFGRILRLGLGGVCALRTNFASGSGRRRRDSGKCLARPLHAARRSGRQLGRRRGLARVAGPSGLRCQVGAGRSGVPSDPVCSAPRTEFLLRKKRLATAPSRTAGLCTTFVPILPGLHQLDSVSVRGLAVRL